MNTLSLPSFTQFQYPLINYGQMANLLRGTEFNRRAIMEHVAMVNYNLPNQHVLVGLLQQLAIDPEWSLERVVAVARLRAYTLSTLFNITNRQHVDGAQEDVFYYNGVQEVLFLIDNQKSYDEGLTHIEYLCPVIPMYCSVNFHSYKPSIERMNKNTLPQKGGVAFIGIDVVELAVGWWLYMKQERQVDSGIHAYLVKYPLVNAQLIHNQLNVINTLHDHIVHGKSYSELNQAEDVTFITSKLDTPLTDYMTWLTKVLLGRRLKDMGQMLAQIKSLYSVPYFDFLQESGDTSLFSQTRWVYEARVLKLRSIYLTLANQLFYKATDINTSTTIAIPKMLNNYQRIPDKIVREHLTALALECQELNRINLQ